MCMSLIVGLCKIIGQEASDGPCFLSKIAHERIRTRRSGNSVVPEMPPGGYECLLRESLTTGRSHTVASRATVVTVGERLRGHAEPSGRTGSQCLLQLHTGPSPHAHRAARADLASGNFPSLIHPGEIQS
jgi:hypothetical protein